MTHRREWIYAWLLLSPALVLLFAFTHIPAISTIWDSFFSTPRGFRPSKFVGLGNYEKLLMDETFWQVLSNSIWYAVVTIPVSVALALLMAIWVDGKLSGRSFVRLAYFAPTVLPLIAVANIWMFFYTPGFGLIDQISGALGYPSVNWLGNPELALGSIMVVSIWKEAGFFMIFYYELLTILNGFNAMYGMCGGTHTLGNPSITGLLRCAQNAKAASDRRQTERDGRAMCLPRGMSS